nr:MAG TPA: hypothetical protein [Caudoviricetes sp.]
MDEMKLQLEVLYKILMLDFHKFYRRQKGSYNLTIKRIDDAVMVSVDWNENKNFVKFQICWNSEEKHTSFSFNFDTNKTDALLIVKDLLRGNEDDN